MTLGSKNLLIPRHRGRQVAVQIPCCQGELGEGQGRDEVVGGGCWCCLGAGSDLMLFDDVGSDLMLFAVGTDMMLFGAGRDMLLL